MPTLGAIGLLLLTALTIFEFNEATSEVLTRNARQAVTRIERLKKDAEVQAKEIEKLQFQRSAKTEELRLKKGELTQKSIYEKGEKQKLIDKERQSIDNDRERIDRTYRERRKILIDQKSNLKSTSRLELIDLRKQVTALDSKIEELDNKINNDYSLKIANQRAANKTEEDRLRLERETLEKQIARTIDRYETRREDARRRGHIGRKKRLDDLIAEEQNEIDRIKSKITPIEDKILELSSKLESIEKDRTLLAERERNTERRIFILRRINAIEVDPKIRQTNANKIESIENQISELDKDYEEKTNDLEELIQTRREFLDDDTRKEELSLSDSIQKTESEIDTIDEKLDLLRSRITSLENQAIEYPELIVLAYDNNLYFRLATWFGTSERFNPETENRIDFESENEEKKPTKTDFYYIPTREDYNKANLYVFVPLGLFIGFVSLTLAWTGVHLKRKRFESNILFSDYKSLQEVEDDLRRLDELETTRENTEVERDALQEREQRLNSQVQELGSRIISIERDRTVEQERMHEMERQTGDLTKERDSIKNERDTLKEKSDFESKRIVGQMEKKVLDSKIKKALAEAELASLKESSTKEASRLNRTIEERDETISKQLDEIKDAKNEAVLAIGKIHRKVIFKDSNEEA